MEARQRSFRAGAVGVALATVVLSGRTEGVLDPWGLVGATQRQLFYECLGVMLLVVVPVIVLTAAFAWWFRRLLPAHQASPNQRTNILAFVVAAMVVAMIVAGSLWIMSHLHSNMMPVDRQMIM